MSYIALYRKWRPTVFDDLVGQESIAKILTSQVINQRIAHAYLFSGGRGTGKTTTAKILSRAVNCLNPQKGNPCNECEICTGILSGNIMDVVEIDAASNNSVDDVRAIRDEVFYTPSVSKYRVYIIDEVHMLSTGAFNALLKILEEPPKHVVFILATTEPHKLPATILSRCQRFEFRQISREDMINRLKIIVKDSGAIIEEEALELITRVADGALRDAISILDQCIGGESTITRQKVIEVIGIPTEEALLDIAEAISEKDLLACINIVNELVGEGKDLSQFISSLVRLLRDMLVYQATQSTGAIYLTSGDTTAIRDISQKFKQTQLIGIIRSLSELESNLKWASMPRVMVEIEMVKLCSGHVQADTSLLEERIAKIESMITGFNPSRVQKQSKGVESGSTLDREDKSKKREPGLPNVNTGIRDELESWGEIVAQLKNSGKMVLYANLIGTKAVRVNDKTIGIIFNKSSAEFGKIVISKAENLAVLKDAVKKVTGEDMNIKCMADDDNGRIVKEDKSAQSNGADKVAEIAQKLDIPLKIIDD